jgi:DNA-binding CsgD family transcriptional regulator
VSSRTPLLTIAKSIAANAVYLALSNSAPSHRPLKIRSAGGMALLTPRERDVVRLTAEGMRNQEISVKLNLSEHTVRNYLLRIFDKLGISSRVELVLYAFSGVEGVTTPLGSRADSAER